MTADLHVTHLRFERQGDASCLGTGMPRISWRAETDARDWLQTAYEIELRDADGRIVAGSGRIDSRACVLVAWPFPPIVSRQRGAVRLRTWGSDGSQSPWSESSFEAGLLEREDWVARFVGLDDTLESAEMRPSPMLRKAFTLTGEVARARLYVTALGLYEAEINGQRVGDEVLSPGWTSYQHRLRYRAFDVTALLRDGENAIGATLADGWFRGRIGFNEGRTNIYGERLAFLGQLEISYTDGRTEVIASDGTWRTVTGPVLSSGIYDGETYDARLERRGWSSPGFDDRDWAFASEVDFATELFAPLGPPVRRIEEVAPRSIGTSPSGRTIVDFGQNLVGRLRLRVTGPAGTTVTLRHAEVLEEGELCTRPLRKAAATDRYVLRGEGLEVWEPRFTFHGFRYAEVGGWPGTLAAGDVTAVVCHTDLDRTGWFECSDELVNRLHENIIWSMRGNFLDVPTDCPQRAERLGWTGDINVFSPTATFLYDVDGFLASWLRDLEADQHPDGTVPFVIPDVLDGRSRPTACWGDAVVVVPRVLYDRYGDREAVAQQYESMRRWVELVASVAGEARLWDRGFQFGDWLDPAAPPDRPRDALTDVHLVATACLVHSADLMAEAAALLGREDDVARYRQLAVEVRSAFAHEYVTPAGRLAADTQTAYALALAYDLIPPGEGREHAADRLGRLVHKNEYRIGTGFVGTPLVCDALTDSGQLEMAYRMLLERSCPSWLYPVTMDATTVWERWDSLRPDGSVNTGEMTSFNHYALGAVGDWLHRVVGGLAPGAPGYERILIAPRPGGGLTSASSRLRTPYGLAECSWRRADGELVVSAKVPPNARATVSLPGWAATEEVGSGDYEWTVPSPNVQHDAAATPSESGLSFLTESG